VQIALGSEALWVRFCETFGLDPAAAGFATNAERVARRAETIALVEGVFAEYPAEELLALLADAGIPAGKVRSLDEVYSWEQTRSQGLVISVDHPGAGRVELPGPPLRFFGPDGAERAPREPEAPPLLDEDGAAIRAWLGLPYPYPYPNPYPPLTHPTP
jgi:crotonobetainyl-CoA:carnitine CoA-transferase CaiB-like acyl-CoA transferase